MTTNTAADHQHQPGTGRQLTLNAFLLNVGHHEAAWRHPRTDPHAPADVQHFIELARIAERAKLDSIFFADGLALWNDIRYNATLRYEPITLLSAIAQATTHIGLIATASTTYYHPYLLARAFASLDHLSRGRAGWNIVTSASDAEAANFGLDAQVPHAERYARAAEFVDVVTRLWDSWDDDALVLDQAAGVYADPDKVHAVDHVGERFTVAGPLNVPRPPQGHPVLVQAGSSEDGKEFAARYAEAVFTAQRSLADGQAFYADLKGRLSRYGRSPDQIKILPGISPVLGSTEAEALRLLDELDELTSPEYGLNQLAGMTGLDLRGLSLDDPLPTDLPGEQTVTGQQSRYSLVLDLARREKLTIRQLLRRLAGGRGHRVFAGTPEQVADELQLWFDNGAADGFNVMAPLLPGGLEDFTTQVVPILQARGLFRTEYPGTTLRDTYGLARPAARHDPAPAQA
ncbi:MAG TPA: LLM class flavin-dependent oxidoreductase [Kineosporiaceae bacterium]|nr:LLM class flavin-dependent oxidoreductase [Kineosporiaceae bacterium]